MLSSRKGNLLCFQWEVERSQQQHRAKMATVTAQTYITAPLQRRKGGLRKTPQEKLAEIDVKRQNAFLVEKMAHICHTGGFQRRALNEFQDVKASLQFGKANIAVAKAVREGRFSARKREHDRVRRENASMVARLTLARHPASGRTVRGLGPALARPSHVFRAYEGPLSFAATLSVTPKRRDIDFNKFEDDFAKSREHHRLSQCNRTAGHTSVFSPIPAHAPCFGAHVNPPPHRKQSREGSAKEVFSPRSSRGAPVQRVYAQTLRSKKRRGELTSSRSPRKRDSPRTGHNGAWNNHIENGAYSGPNSERGVSGMTPRRPQTAGGVQRRQEIVRPHTALGLRRGRDRKDFFDARAADPGWCSRRERLADRPASAPERVEWGSLADRETDLQGYFGDVGDGADHRECHGASKEVRVVDDVSVDPTSGAKNSLGFFGRTLLAKAKVIVDGTAKKRARGGTAVDLRCHSLDGLIREGGRIRKTLRGFVVEASSTPRQTQSAGAMERRVTGCVIGSASVAVSAMQEFLANAASEDGENAVLGPFQGAEMLDDKGNYPELGALLSQGGQRVLYQLLLGSCRVIVSNSSITMMMLQRNAGRGLEMSATTETPSTTHGPTSGSKRRQNSPDRHPTDTSETKAVVCRKEDAKMGSGARNRGEKTVRAGADATQSAPVMGRETRQPTTTVPDLLPKVAANVTSDIQSGSEDDDLEEEGEDEDEESEENEEEEEEEEEEEDESS